jgi:hypothetical protein
MSLLLVISVGATMFIRVPIALATPSLTNSITFDGEHTQYEIDHSLGNPGKGTGTITFEAWIRTTSTDNQALFSKNDASGGNTICFYLWNGYYDIQFDNTTGINTNVPVPLNQWVFVTYVISGSNAQVYQNGNLVWSTTNAPTRDGTWDSSPWHIGMEMDPGLAAPKPSDFFSGQLNYIAVWNTARTQAQIQSDMNTVLSGSESGLVAYWITDKNLSTGILYDQTPNSNDAVGRNFARSMQLTATQNGSSGYKLSWNSVTGATTYVLTRNGSTIYSGSSTSYTDSVSTSGSYTYSVKAVGTDGETLADYVLVNGKSALPFNGTNQWIDVHGTLGNPGANSSSVTAEGWFFLNDLNNETLIGKNTSTGNDAILFGVYDGRYHINDSDELYYTDVSPPVGQWVYISFVVTGSKAYIYQNGSLVWSGSVNTRTEYDSSDWNIGQDWDGSNTSDFFSGYVHDVAIWNTARSQTQIQSDMNTTLTGSESGLVLYYQLSPTTTRVAYDQSSSNADGYTKNYPVDISLSDSSVQSDQATLAWTAIPNASTYVLTRNSSTVYSGSALSYTDLNLVENTSYTYSVYAKNTYGESMPDSVNFTTPTGAKSISAPTLNNFPSTTLSGAPQNISTSFSGPLEITDTTGLGDGWHVTVQSTQLQESGGKGLKLPSGSITLNKPTSITQTDGPSCPAPSVKGGPWVIDEGSADTILSAAQGAGKGTWDVTFPANALQLNLNPATTFTDSGITTYNATITWSVVAGP